LLATVGNTGTGSKKIPAILVVRLFNIILLKTGGEEKKELPTK
jgi:hypothetical protein